MKIDLATADDVPRLCELLGLLFAQEAEFAPDAAKQAAGLRAVISDRKIGVILVLREDGEIIGMASLLFTISTFLGAKAAWLEDMIVHPDHRGRGRGSRLLQAAIAHATTAGCARITLLTDGANGEAKEFYRRAGFSASSMTPMRLLLPLDPA
jgi:GNAT superfamily N-acetyltransferase